MELDNFYWWEIENKSQDEINSIFEQEKNDRPWCRFFLEDYPLCPGNLNSICRIGFVPFRDCLTDRYYYIKKNKNSETVASGGIVTRIHISDIKKELPQGWQGAVRKSFEDKKSGKRPNTLVALLAFTSPRFRGRGLSDLVISHICDKGVEKGYSKLIIPALPPSQFEKDKVSLSMEELASWRDDDGKIHDYWLRLHVNKGAEIIGFEEKSHRFVFSLTDFSTYVSSTPIPVSGTYLVNLDKDSALGINGKSMWQNVFVDRERDIVTFDWGCIWVSYNLTIN